MGAALALVMVHAALISVSGGDARCPSVKQVNEAVSARLPGVLVPASPEPPPGVLRLMLRATSPTEHQFVLRSSTGKVLLSRTLPVPPAATERDCEALAETVALIVDRYLQELAYQAEVPAAVEVPAPPPIDSGPLEPRWELFAGGTWQPASGPSALSRYEARIGAGRTLGRSARLALELVVGVQGAEEPHSDTVTASLRRFPAELRLLWRSAPRTLRVEAGPFAGLEVLSWSSDRPLAHDDGIRLTPLVGGELGLRAALGSRAFVRLLGSLGVAMLRHRFADEPGDIERFGTERTYVKMALEGGLAFW
jgi:hypothetical protein